MSHLPSERLAALTDEPPTATELAHLASCEWCARERAAYAALRGMAATEQARIGAPLTSWDQLAPSLREDGTIDTGTWRVARRPRRVRDAWLRAAAAIVLVAGGVAAGRYSAHASVIPAEGTQVAEKAGPNDDMAFSSLEQARAARDRSELMYQSAALYLAQYDSTEQSVESPAAMRRRLATLDRVGETVREALNESPYDPVINGYYLTTLGQREATLRQLNASLPQGVRLNSF
jgi:hypothetical protein